MSSDSLASTSEVSVELRPNPSPASQSPAATVRVGVIGYGYWGPNIVRNLHSLEHCEVVSVCDKNPAALKRAQKSYPGVHLTTDFSEVLRSPDIDAVAIVTPVWTHFELAKAALENGKHVFVEKPFTSTSQQAEQLIELAERKNLRIMVDHTFLFSGAVRKIRELVDNGTLGPALLLRFDARQPGAVSARRQRPVGPGPARPVDHGLLDRRETRGGGRDRQQSPEPPGRHGVHHRLFPKQRDRAFQRQLAVAGEGAEHPDRRHATRCWCGTTSTPTRRSRSTTRESRSRKPRASTTCW